MTLLNVDFLVRLGKALQKRLEADDELNQVLKELEEINKNEETNIKCDSGIPDCPICFGSDGDQWEGDDLSRSSGEPRESTNYYNLDQRTKSSPWF